MKWILLIFIMGPDGTVSDATPMPDHTTCKVAAVRAVAKGADAAICVQMGEA